MEISQEYRLNKLGIDIWKKRYQETNLIYNKNYLIEDKYLFCFENKGSLFDKSNEVIFFRTLAISLGKEKVSQVSNLDSSLKITNIFYLIQIYLIILKNIMILSYLNARQFKRSVLQKKIKKIFLVL